MLPELSNIKDLKRSNIDRAPKPFIEFEFPSFILRVFMVEFAEHANTELTYLYRDASNYKFFGSVVISGKFKLSEINCLLHDKEFFIPELVGLKSLVPNIKNEDDHIWHELVSANKTNKLANSITALSFVELFNLQYAKGWVQ